MVVSTSWHRPLSPPLPATELKTTENQDKKDQKEQIKVIYEGLDIRGAHPETDALQGWLVANKANEDKLKTFSHFRAVVLCILKDVQNPAAQ